MSVISSHGFLRQLFALSLLGFMLSACAAEQRPVDAGLHPGISVLIEFHRPPADPEDPELLRSLVEVMPDTDTTLSLFYVHSLAVGVYLYRVTGLPASSRQALLHALMQHPAVSHAEYSRRVRAQ